MSDNGNNESSIYKELKESISDMDDSSLLDVVTGTDDAKATGNAAGSGKAAARTGKRKRKKRRKTIWDEILSYIKIMVAAFVIAFLCNTFVIVNAQVPTGSMRDTILEGDRLIGFRFSYIFSDPQRGDIIIFKFPDNEEETYVKRVIGIPGDIVEIMKDYNGVTHVYVNGEMLDEPYLREPMVSSGDYQKYIVPAGHYFVMGDNRNSSLDSRYWENKYVAKEKILAKAIFKYYKNFEMLE